MKDVLRFLQELSKHNNKEWFNANREWYEESRNKVLFVTEILINEIRKFDPEIPVMNPKDCVFRIFRDVRFSHDKRPYKTNFGSFISKGGRKSILPGYYFHIEPNESFAGGGVYMPPAEPLKLIRNYIAEHAEEFLEIINDKDFKSFYPEMYDHQLKTAPKGFDKNFEYIHLIKYQSYVFSARLENNLLTGEGLIEYLVQAYKQLYKINSFLNNAL